jgi:hypothetical protein
MKFNLALPALFSVILFCSGSFAQKSEMTVSLNETFFDSLIDTVFQNFGPPEFSIAKSGNYGIEDTAAVAESDGVVQDVQNSIVESFFLPVSYVSSTQANNDLSRCGESIKILRENNGVRTSVRFREGKIYVPLAFSGSYTPMFVGCVEFGGWAEAVIDLTFDPSSQSLTGRARVLNVSLNGTGGVGGTLIAKMIQGSIDRKLNPIEVLNTEKLTFVVPIPNTGNIRMKAVDVKTRVGGSKIDIIVEYEFYKA